MTFTRQLSEFFVRSHSVQDHSAMDTLSATWDAAREYSASYGYGDVVFFTAGLSVVHASVWVFFNVLHYVLYHFDLFPQYRIR